MAIEASVVNGTMQYTATESSSSSSESSNSLDKDAFLQLLVAQMQYQDPLEPMDNTEYVSQLATFSQVEELQNIQSAVSNSQAAALLGKQVIIETTNSAGVSSQVSGYVDYIQEENGEMKLGIDGNLYSMSDLYTVIDTDYLTAASLSSQFSTLISTLPSVDELTVDDKDAIEAMRDVYDSLTSYQKSFIEDDALSTLTSLEEKLEELLAATESEAEE